MDEEDKAANQQYLDHWAEEMRTKMIALREFCASCAICKGDSRES
jgi:hypothetical protein